MWLMKLVWRNGWVVKNKNMVDEYVSEAINGEGDIVPFPRDCL